MALHKNWNVRDQTDNELRIILEKKYKEIDAQYKLLRKIADLETAKKMLDEIWHLKSFVNTIELEQIRRGYYNGISQENEYAKR